jgi:hypothetical protein
MGPKRPGHHRGVSSARSRGSSIGSVIYMPHHIRSISSTYQSASQKLPMACPVAGQGQLHLMRDPPRSPDVVNSPISSRASLLENLRCIMLQTNQIFRKYLRYKSRHIPTIKEERPPDITAGQTISTPSLLAQSRPGYSAGTDWD